MSSPITPKPVDSSFHLAHGHVQASAGGHRTIATVWRGPVGYHECACGRITEVYDGGFSDCRFARLESEYASRLDALRIEMDRRRVTAEAAADSDLREWRRVQRLRRRTA